MKVIGIRENPEKVNTRFVLDDFSVIGVPQAVSLAKNRFLDNCEAVIATDGTKPYIRKRANTSVSDNLDFLAIQCDPGDYLYFNGTHLSIRSLSGSVKKEFRAYSGHRNSTPDEQNIKNKGPLPEGNYTALNTTPLIRARDPQGWENRLERSWGDIATFLEPNAENEMYGRDEFFIHGGSTPGSNGCIDLVENNNEFHCYTLLYDFNLELTVDYTEWRKSLA